MATLSAEDVHALTSHGAADAPVVSCYLDVDGAKYVRPIDYERAFDAMVRRVTATCPAGSDISRDLDRVTARVAEGFDRSHVRGVAVFACAASDLFVVHELPVSVRNECTINPTPAVGQLEVVVQQAERIAVLAVDKQRTRIFVFRLGELIEHDEHVDDLGRDYDTVGVADRGGVAEHRQELGHQHLRHAADLAWSVYSAEPFDRLVLAASPKIAAELEGDLHPYLRERLHSRLDLSPAASHAEIRAAAMDAERAIELERERRLVESLRDAVGTSAGVVGLDDTLDALAGRRAERLMVSDGFAQAGWRCPSCERLASVGRFCACGAEMDQVADVVAEAVESALAQSCAVDVCMGNADLDVLGRVGALLRF